ncbi:hypothetical protein RBH29_00160 [Herbivorax sp. ANBcel31]|uniref:hypothetical protein n=1 Tax=Herbivorax sp. ANBcel31 TaxID=3069754 RepID=UPI0027B3F2E4|nr:hypothetical protein [Herbivorax sp. ANBcel31]MDQ2084848.1 hypothetical protein [Herbivorax sp. ANBcel31]
MKFFYDFYDELKKVFENCQEIISNYPEGLSDTGKKYLSRYNVFEENASKNYICYLLSFWVNHECGVKKDICIKITVANTFMMLFAFIQDDLIDREIELKDMPEMISLGNLFFLEFMSIYREIFESHKKIWDYYDFYMKRWSKSITDEQKNINNEISLLEEEMVSIVSSKAELVKIAVTGICVLSKKEKLLNIYSKAVDKILFSLQIADDYIDWEKDLKKSNTNILLREFMKKEGIKYSMDIKASDVKEEIIFGTIVDKLCTVLRENSYNLNLMIEDKNIYIKEYNNSILGFMEDQRRKCLEKKRKIEMGGFSNWVDKNIFNI